MTEAQRNLFTLSLVCASAVSVVGGIAVREKVDTGAPSMKGAIVATSLLELRSLGAEIPEAQYFEQLEQLLRREYVEPVPSSVKLASGAVRGMVSSLDDARCLFFDSEMMRLQEMALKGSYEGIGADLGLVRPRSSSASAPDGSESPIPRLMVASVVPGGPADRAGVKPGDIAESIDDRWIINSDVVDRIRLTQQKVLTKEWPASKLDELRTELRQMLDSNITPYRALERLSKGATGSLRVVWKREGKTVTTSLEKGVSQIPAVRRVGASTWQVRIVPGAGKQLRDALKGAREVSLDLRNAGANSFEALSECLAAVAPSGTYGRIRRSGGKAPEAVKVPSGNDRAPKVKLLINTRTRGAAEAFALALSKSGRATLDGGAMAGDPAVIELRKLPEGSGYSLVTGTFEATSVRKEARGS